MFKDPMIILISLFVMIYMSWSLTLFVFLMLPVVGYLIGKVGKSLKNPPCADKIKWGPAFNHRRIPVGIAHHQGIQCRKEDENRFCPTEYRILPYHEQPDVAPLPGPSDERIARHYGNCGGIVVWRTSCTKQYQCFVPAGIYYLSGIFL